MSNVLGRLIREACTGDTAEVGIDRIFDLIDDLLRDGVFEPCDRLLAEEFSDLPTVHLLGLLSITAPAADKLPHRAEFARHVRTIIMERDPDRVNALLAGLE